MTRSDSGSEPLIKQSTMTGQEKSQYTVWSDKTDQNSAMTRQDELTTHCLFRQYKTDQNNTMTR